MSRFPKWLHRIADKVLDREARNYVSQLSQMDQIFTNSQNVHDRLLDFCGFESEIVYPPTNTDFFIPFQQGSSFNIPFHCKDYFYSWARLSPPKRVDIIVDAFLDMPEKNLVISYGKNDPEKNAILEKIKHVKNIFAVESPSDTELLSLIQ